LKIWNFFANVEKIQKKFKKFNYKNTKNQQNSKCVNYIQIEKDVKRTILPEFLDEEKKTIFQNCLKNILYAYTYLNPNVNYLQGMNFIVASILFNITQSDFQNIQETEIDTFWLFVSLMENYRIKDYYLKMKKIFELSNSLEILLQKNLKNLYDFINYKQVS
jgi:hypothetical protein